MINHWRSLKLNEKNFDFLSLDDRIRLIIYFIKKATEKFKPKLFSSLIENAVEKLEEWLLTNKRHFRWYRSFCETVDSNDFMDIATRNILYCCANVFECLIDDYALVTLYESLLSILEINNKILSKAECTQVFNSFFSKTDFKPKIEVNLKDKQELSIFMDYLLENEENIVVNNVLNIPKGPIKITGTLQEIVEKIQSHKWILTYLNRLYK